jgi:MFS transporter, putative metabolite:H+ symporter
MIDNTTPQGIRAAFNAIVIVAALGYFVDIYDLILFGVVRSTSLADIGIAAADITDVGISLNNWQMFGMLIGGIIWGIMGDRKGRVTVLFGSILLYSTANIANGCIESLGANALLGYKALRFVAGLGLAGELGAGITLVSETMHKQDRGFGTMLMVMVGALGGVAAATIGNAFGWQNAYFIGGGLGLCLLVLRVGTYESNLFKHAQADTAVSRGNFLQLFTNRRRFFKYLACIGVGVPIWFSVGILVLLAKEFAAIIGVHGIAPEALNRTAIMWCYVGLAVGDILAGLLSQIIGSRRKVVAGFVIAHAFSILAYLFVRDISATEYALLIFLVGGTTGFWGLFATIATEQFGTNIRATVATTVPNFVRGTLILISFSFKGVRDYLGGITEPTAVIQSALIVGMVCIAISLVSIWSLGETFGKDLDYVE